MKLFAAKSLGIMHYIVDDPGTSIDASLKESSYRTMAHHMRVTHAIGWSVKRLLRLKI